MHDPFDAFGYKAIEACIDQLLLHSYSASPGGSLVFLVFLVFLFFLVDCSGF